MAHVITEPCVANCDTACVTVCPVDCIVGPVPVDELQSVPHAERAIRWPTLQLFIDPDICICCGSCVSECPVDAIFDEDDVPAKWHPYIEKNAAFFRR